MESTITIQPRIENSQTEESVRAADICTTRERSAQNKDHIVLEDGLDSQIPSGLSI